MDSSNSDLATHGNDDLPDTSSKALPKATWGSLREEQTAIPSDKPYSKLAAVSWSMGLILDRMPSGALFP